jgi:hypothetical protein
MFSSLVPALCGCTNTGLRIRFLSSGTFTAQLTNKTHCLHSLKMFLDDEAGKMAVLISYHRP